MKIFVYLSMLKLKLKEVLLAQGKKSPNSWLRENCKMTFAKAYNLLNNKQKSISYADLSRICIALECTPNELFWWENTPKTVVNEWHPLKAHLKSPAKDYNWTVRIQGLNPDRVEALKDFMEQLEMDKIQSTKKAYEEVINKDIEKNEIVENEINKDEEE